MYGHCEVCGQIFGTMGRVNKLGQLIQYQECKHMSSRELYKIVSYEDMIMDDSNKIKLQAVKEDKLLWVQAKVTDLTIMAKESTRDLTTITYQDFCISSMPYMVADKLTFLIDDTTELVIKDRFIKGSEQYIKFNALTKEEQQALKDGALNDPEQFWRIR